MRQSGRMTYGITDMPIIVSQHLDGNLETKNKVSEVKQYDILKDLNVPVHKPLCVVHPYIHQPPN